MCSTHSRHEVPFVMECGRPSSERNCLAFFFVEQHLPFKRPLKDGIDVALKHFGILIVVNSLVK